MGRERVLTDFAKVINSDRYQYTESDIFLMEKMEEKEAIFDMYFRKTEDGGFAVVSGVQEVIELIEILNKTSEEEKREYFSKIIEEEHLLEYLVKMKFTGNLYAMRDGEIAYPNEPIISIKAPLIQAKILETPILNLMNMQLAIATKSSRITRAAYPVPVSSFGSRRAHGFDSAVSGTKASIIGGCLSHSNLVTEFKYGVPSVGTMAHSYIQAFGVGAAAEKIAFDTFIKHRRERKANSLILLIDTYNTLGIGLKNAIQSFKDNGIDDSYEGNYGIRIDSGDLAYLSKKCRKELDTAGLKKAKIFLTNSLNESLIKSLKEQGACVDIFGVGDAIAVSKSNPCFGGVYKIVEIDYKPVIKLSEDVIKISNPGFKEVYRIYDKEGLAYADLITLVYNDEDKEKLLKGENLVIRDEKYEFKSSLLRTGEYSYKKLTCEFIKDGKIMEQASLLKDVVKSREYYLNSLTKLSEERKRLENPHQYKVDLSKDLLELKYNLIKEIKSQIN
ncbi:MULTISPECIES: nicotinate phosphoribosyltransferase [Cetobacterium]|jgi:nicotinate phosphoribosyltransferase|uniref:Nicotinate phosphoribosyltransferase n=1 Tax=Candidatus Cetobacterium colombiensis TaxID=3073100 RepID=A0ABU4W706_9FUSO|nr:nicotinate phosphoribosyltransferase [Candidatus Cetobacterium colombiensis]MDX8335307.1 nicotinate phosphoribosyltransferase [Candidatus Cetobacterium colombiensis]